MKIRSITYFDTIPWPIDENQIQAAGQFITAAKETFQDRGFDVQTTRLASAPFPLILKDRVLDETVNYAVEIESMLQDFGFDYASIGPAVPGVNESYQVIPDVLSSTQNIFTAAIISSDEIGVDPVALKKSAEVIIRNSQISPNGFANLRFAALANVPPGGPFLPAAYNQFENQPSFAIAVEAADLAVSAFEKADSLEFARSELVERIENAAREIAAVGENLHSRYKRLFDGIDFSLAPFPTLAQSIGTAIENLGLPGIGYHGSLAAVAILAEAIDRAEFPKVGFNGIMLPLLEDTILARNAGDNLTLNDLLLYSAVCGTGLDTIPLPGDVTRDQIYAVLLDLAVFAQRLGKPLTARLMPIPGKAAGEPTEFDFEYFENSKVMRLNAHPLSGFLAADEAFQIRRRNKP